MATYEVTCINKQDRHNPYERIAFIGIDTAQGLKKYTVAEMVDFIDNQGHRFFVYKNGKQVYLETAISPHGNKYVKTEADGKEPNNLLSLPECR